MEASYHDRSTNSGWSWARAVVKLTSAGAIDTQVVDHPDIALTYASSTGKYTGTFPYCVEADIRVEAVSSSSTVTQFSITAKDAAAGTFSLSCFGPTGSLADPASGNVLTFTFRLRHSE
jgi:hypothetical protein